MAVSSSMQAQSRPDEPAVRSLLRERLAGYSAGAIIAGVIDENGRTIAGEEAGSGKKNGVDGTTVFEIGSVTKAFTGILLADMVRRGEVELDDPVRDYLPETVTGPRKFLGKITLLDLATHTSGLPGLPDNIDPADPANPYADYTVERLYDYLSGQKPQFSFTRKYEYSNLGMGLLGHVLALKAKKNYETLVKERILAPLGMTSTGITLTPDMRRRLTPGHDMQGIDASNWDIPTFAGAGALRSTMDDMLRFVAANIGLMESAVSPAMRDAIEPRRETGMKGLKIGLGWHVLEKEGIIWHNGETGGYHSFVGFHPGRRTGVVILSSIAINIDDIGLHILDTTFPLQKPVEKPAGEKTRTPITLDESILDRYVGSYQLAPDFIITVTRSGTRMFVQATGQGKLAIYPESETEFFLTDVEARVTFEKDAAGKVTALVLHQNGMQTRGARMEEKIEKKK